ncbi:MAG: tRNA pseudouridine(38-40) synthase TruA [Candidatus Omnitrophota bacterium]|jgi:tRNA pseudouridine38-40 synthase
MRNFKLQIEYDGTRYYGWQVQNGAKASRSYRSSRTIQHILESKLRKILQQDISLIVAGRTDSGVHACAQVANFKSSSKMPLARMQWALNGLLPEDIKITRINYAPIDFNSRFWAKSKTYRYTVLNRNYSSALLRNHVYFFHYPLDLQLMRKEARCLLGKHNFKAFQASDTRERNPVKNIKSVKIRRSKGLLHIDIEADGFLYNMVRNIAGTLLEIGRGRFAEGSMCKIIASRNRALAGPTVPAKGLCLLKVRY